MGCPHSRSGRDCGRDARSGSQHRDHGRSLSSRGGRPNRDPATAAALNDFSSLIIGIAAPVALAVFVAATGIVSIATGVLPRWLGWLSLLLALGLLIPYISFVFWVPFGVWVLVVSVLLYLRPEALHTRTAPA